MLSPQAQADLAWFKACLSNKSLVEKLKKIKLLVTDIDGSLTDCTIYLFEDGEEVKGYSIQDGYAMSKLQKQGLFLAWLTGKKGKSIEIRAERLGIPKELLAQDVCTDKREAMATFKQHLGVSQEEVLFFGDDVLDTTVLPEISLLACPANALFYVQHTAELITPRSGGEGAFRLIIDLVLYVQGKHFTQSLLENALR